jgi:hypothetical protein
MAPTSFWICSNMFVFLFRAPAPETISDGDDEIFVTCCGRAGSIGAWSGGAFVAVIDDCGAFGFELLWLGFWFPDLGGILSICGTVDDGICGAVDGGLPPQASSAVEAFSAEARLLCSFIFLGGCLVFIGCAFGQLFSMLNHRTIL